MHGVEATPLSNYNVTLFLTCQPSGCRVNLYKHSGTTANEKNRVLPQKLDAQSFKGASVRVYNLQGKLVADLPGAWDGTGLSRSDSRNLASGLYFLKIRSGSQEIARKYLVQR